jgi:hypothetical protein
MAILGVSRWFWVLEFQEKTGEGWPHWHVLADLSHYPGGRLPRNLLKRAWHLWRDVWGVGGLDLRKEGKFRNSLHAVLYVTKYLVKWPKRGHPTWVYKQGGTSADENKSIGIRRFQGSRAVGALRYETERPPDPSHDETVPRIRQTIGEGVASCRQRLVLFRETLDTSTGESRRLYAGTVFATEDDVLKRSEAIRDDWRVGARVQRGRLSWFGGSRVICRVLFEHLPDSEVKAYARMVSDENVYLQRVGERLGELLAEWDRNGVNGQNPSGVPAPGMTGGGMPGVTGAAERLTAEGVQDGQKPCNRVRCAVPKNPPSQSAVGGFEDRTTATSGSMENDLTTAGCGSTLKKR